MRYRESLRSAVPPHAHGVVGAAGAAWLGCLIGLSGAWALGIPVLAAAAALRRHARAAVLCGVLAAGVLSGTVAGVRLAATLSAPLPTSGPVDLSARVVADPVSSSFGGPRLLVATTGDPAGGWPPPGVRLVVEVGGEPVPVVAGDVVRVQGLLRDRPGRLRGDPYRAIVASAEVARLAGPSGPFFGLGNRLRALILERLAAGDGGSGAALLAGFLVGETSGLPEPDLENLRRSGLTHFVAVSGSNVAMFLGAWWLVAGPLGLGHACAPQEGSSPSAYSSSPPAGSRRSSVRRRWRVSCSPDASSPCRSMPGARSVSP